MPEVLDHPSAPALAPVTAALRMRATAMLVLCCVFWGWSFPTMKIASLSFESHLNIAGALGSLASRALFGGLRFAFAALLFWLFTLPHQRRFSRADIWGGVTVGASFGLGMLFQILGLAWTLPSVSGFLTSLTVVFTPLLQAAVMRRRVGGVVWLAVLVAVGGVTLLSCPNPAAQVAHIPLDKPPLPFLGEILTVIGSVLFTFQILFLDHYGQKANPLRLSFVMFVTTAILGLTVAAAASGRAMFRPEVVTGIATDHTIWWIMATLVLFSSIGAMHLMNTYQPRISPAAASIIYCSEPVFALLFSLGFGIENLTLLSVAGGAAVIAAVLIVVKKP